MTDDRKLPVVDAVGADGERPPTPTGPTLEEWAARGRLLAGKARSGETDEAPNGPVVPPSHDPSVVHRRTVLKVLAVAAAVPVLSCDTGSGADGGEAATSAPAQPATNPHALGTPTDPDLLSPAIPWDMVLSEEEMVTVAALADVIIPADNRSPSASAVWAHNFVNEWVSAPFEGQRRDLVLVRGGLAWLNTESTERYGSRFAELTPEQHRAICDDICYLPAVAPELRRWAHFFDKMRDLVSTGFWTTHEGMADLGYEGNVPLPSFDGPPREVLERLGLV